MRDEGVDSLGKDCALTLCNVAGAPGSIVCLRLAQRAGSWDLMEQVDVRQAGQAPQPRRTSQTGGAGPGLSWKGTCSAPTWHEAVLEQPETSSSCTPSRKKSQ
eukprot:1305853-Rhodomonas_salina.3